MRLIATVTISAPLIDIAALVSFKSLYLPVPNINRELYDLPSIFNFDNSASTYCIDNFYFIIFF